MTDEKINRLVHEKVMGLDVYEPRIGMSGFKGYDDGCSLEEAKKVIQRYKERVPSWEERLELPWIKSPHFSCPDYCNSWEAMGEVIEKMTKKDHEIIGAFKLEHFSLWTAHFSYEKTGGGQFDFTSSHPLAPKAVALAALKMKGVDIDK